MLGPSNETAAPISDLRVFTKITNVLPFVTTLAPFSNSKRPSATNA